MDTLGKRIAQHRKDLGLTQDQLAEKLGLTAQAVSKWENDLSCPDITILPRLADIFSTTTDALLGREAATPVCVGEVVEEPFTKDNGFTFDSGSGKMDFHWEGVKLEGIGLACWVLLTGILYLYTQIFHVTVSFWNILWPGFLFVYGMFGLYPKFSVLRLGCALVGAYFILDKLHWVSIALNSGIIIAALILLFGFALLADAFRKKKRMPPFVTYTDRNGKEHRGTMHNDYTAEDNSFRYESSFGDSTQNVILEHLQYGEISTNFGDYTVNLAGVRSVDENCRLKAECSFGELDICIPRCFAVVSASSTSFASFDVEGKPDSDPSGTIYLDASVSFGEITVHYI